MINTLLGMAIDIKQKRPALANVTRRLSRPGSEAIALRMVWQVAQVKIALVGMGASREDAGIHYGRGTAVAIGTGQFVNPRCCVDVITGIKKYCEEKGVKNIGELRGVAWRNADS